MGIRHRTGGGLVRETISHRLACPPARVRGPGVTSMAGDRPVAGGCPSSESDAPEPPEREQHERARDQAGADHGVGERVHDGPGVARRKADRRRVAEELSDGGGRGGDRVPFRDRPQRAGHVGVETKAEETNVTGKSQISPALCATSTLRAISPIAAPTQDIAKAKRRISR